MSLQQGRCVCVGHLYSPSTAKTPDLLQTALLKTPVSSLEFRLFTGGLETLDERRGENKWAEWLKGDKTETEENAASLPKGSSREKQLLRGHRGEPLMTEDNKNNKNQCCRVFPARRTKTPGPTALSSQGLQRD